MSLAAPGRLTPNRQRQATITTATKSFAPRVPVLHIRLPLLRQSHMATTTVESVGESVGVTKSLYSVCRLTRSLLYPLSLWLSCHPSSVLTLDTAHQIYAVPRQVHTSQMHLPYRNEKYTKSVDCGVREWKRELSPASPTLHPILVGSRKARTPWAGTGPLSAPCSSATLIPASDR